MATPRQALAPPDAARTHAPYPVGPLRAGFAHALRSWRPLLVVVLVQLLLGLTVVLPFVRGMARHLDHHPHAAALAGAPGEHDRALGWVDAGLSSAVLSEARREEADTLSALDASLFWVAIIAWLFGALAAGGALGTASTSGSAVTVAAFLGAGGVHFGRMLRAGIVFAVFWVLAFRVVLEGWGAAVAPDELLASSQAVGWWGERIREAVLLVLFLWFHVAADVARADLVAGRRRSALLGFVRGLAAPLRSPLRVGLTGLLLGGLGLGAAAGIAVLYPLAQADHVLSQVTCLLLIQLAVGARWAGRLAWLGALQCARTSH